MQHFNLHPTMLDAAKIDTRPPKYQRICSTGRVSVAPTHF